MIRLSDHLEALAVIHSSRILFKKNSTNKQYEDNIKALLNNPQWRKKYARTPKTPNRNN